MPQTLTEQPVPKGQVNPFAIISAFRRAAIETDGDLIRCKLCSKTWWLGHEGFEHEPGCPMLLVEN